MNKEHCLAFNKMVDCYLNNQINNLFDLEENMKALNNFQAKIDELQEMKDLAQIEHNGIALTILRKYVMREKSGKLLMRNLIRQYYDLNDEQIKRYEKYTRPSGGYYVTNAMVLYLTYNQHPSLYDFYYSKPEDDEEFFLCNLFPAKQYTPNYLKVASNL